tara:strand:- start:45 stop:407 length:363 start_codon:yes stop_codon:yes gene_type:complete
MAFLENRNTKWLHADNGGGGDLVSAIAAAAEMVAGVATDVWSQKQEYKLDDKLWSREFRNEVDRKQREAQNLEIQRRQNLTLGTLAEVRKSNQKKMIRNIALGIGIFGIIAIGVYYAGKK